MIHPQTQWIGGSYEAACGGRLPPATVTARVLRALTIQPGLTTAELSVTLQLPVRTVNHALSTLRAAGKLFTKKKLQLRKVGGGPVNLWYISERTVK